MDLTLPVLRIKSQNTAHISVFLSANSDRHPQGDSHLLGRLKPTLWKPGMSSMVTSLIVKDPFRGDKKTDRGDSLRISLRSTCLSLSLPAFAAARRKLHFFWKSARSFCTIFEVFFTNPCNPLCINDPNILFFLKIAPWSCWSVT